MARLTTLLVSSLFTLDIARYIDKPYLGLMGVIMSLPKDEATLNELVEQLNSLSKTGND